MSHSAVLFPVQSFINKSPAVSEPHSDGKPCSFFLWTVFICQISYCRTSMGLFGGGYIPAERLDKPSSFLHRHPESGCVCLDPSECPGFFFYQAAINVNKKVFLIEQPG